MMPTVLYQKPRKKPEPQPEIITEAVEIYEMARSIPRDVAKIGWGALIPIGSLAWLVWLVWSALN